jgi:hypothetical protein
VSVVEQVCLHGKVYRHETVYHEEIFALIIRFYRIPPEAFVEQFFGKIK